MRNRLCSSTELTGSFDKLHASNTTEESDSSYLEHQVCLFGPERYEPRYDYPLIVWLHSCGSCEHELENVMPALSMQNYVSCAPRGTHATNPEGTKFAWGKSASATAIAEEIVFESISLAARQFSIAERKIFLAGFGSGGTAAWRIALRYPNRFAGVLSICGDFPHRNQPLANLHKAQSLPTMWLFGNQSKTCGTEQVCQSLPVLHSAALTIDIREYSCGDELLTNMLSDINSWIMERVTQQPAHFNNASQESFSNN